MEPQQKPKKKRFLLVKLEDRIVPAHLGSVNVADAPGIDVAQVRQPHIDFEIAKASGGSNALSGSGGSIIQKTVLCSGSLES